MADLEPIDELELGGIAQYLADLSQDGPLPLDVDQQRPIPFQAESISFVDNDWLFRVLAVQLWLCLDRPIGLDTPPQQAALDLMDQICPGPVESCLTINGDIVALTELGVQHLDTRLSRASAHREAFLEALDDGQALRQATDEWRQLWEESSALARQPAAIKAEVKTLTIRNFSDFAKDDDLELNPSYQRDSVWSISDSQLLIDSILRGIPIPSIILNQLEEDRKLQIVDGKQRLTAILRFIGQHPTAREYVRNLGAEAEFDKDTKKFLRKHHLKSREIAEHYLPFRVMRYDANDPLHKLSGKYYSEIKDVEIPVGQNKIQVREIFDKAHSKYSIPVILYENTRLQDIHHVFSIYNKQGKKLNAEELRNATYHHVGLTKLLLVLSGDRPFSEELAPYLPDDLRSTVGDIGEALKDRGFGTMRFKRTKVLSWVCALLLHSPNSRDGNYAAPSTASHIDALLEAISDKPGQHPLSQKNALITLARDIETAVTTHAEVEDAWSPRFRSKKGVASGWEELPLVGSLLSTLILAATGEIQRLSEAIPAVRAVTEANPGPKKTQNKTQWSYIGQVTTSILQTLGIDLDTATTILTKRYGYSCLPVLSAMAAMAEA
ncbi:conserved hypothetical protein [Cupriavidus taiwanensis]|uniref:GmrSD restriction endonucleases N-terminal domain-containing protein n=1 Tax=Cupriavidus taiwanensis TaxID=164546 RepID=A0A375B7V5_9BURK|nr:DUF262 domain-containing protein [Cupriavidus taiwanensis]SOY39719.1 conserved hypothetical protein [Cupriavidus taiwanensis]